MRTGALLCYLCLKARPGNAPFFSHAVGLSSFAGLLEGETLPKLGQAAQKQMRSDTGAKEYSPEPPRAHTVFNPEVTMSCELPSCREYTDMERGRRMKAG